jgi:hypothetical protein
LDGADALMDHLVKADAVLADKAYDTDERMRRKLALNACEAVISPKKNRLRPSYYDKYLRVFTFSLSILIWLYVHVSLT